MVMKAVEAVVDETVVVSAGGLVDIVKLVVTAMWQCNIKTYIKINQRTLKKTIQPSSMSNSVTMITHMLHL